MRSKLDVVLVAALAYFTAEILLRRWAWGQAPTPVPAWLVYALVAGNVLVVGRSVAARLTGGSGSLPRRGA